MESSNNTSYHSTTGPNKSIQDYDNSKSMTTTSKNPLRVLMGKQVFLDLPNSGKLLNQVRECLSYVDVKFADCLSKEVDYVITNRFSTDNCPSTPNNNANDSSSHHIDSGGKKSKTSPGALNFLSRSSSLVNRTQAILEKASKGSPSTMDVVATAKRLGINVMNVADLDSYVKKYIQKKRSIGGGENNNNNNNSLNNSNNPDDSKQKLNDSTVSQSSIVLNASKKESPKTSSQLPNSLAQTFAKKGLEKTNTSNAFKLKNPFLKIESICKQYKPIYQEFSEWHDINLDKIKGTHSPFQAYFSDDDTLSNKSSSELSTSSRRQMHSNQNDENNPKEIIGTQESTTTVFKSPTSSALVTTTKQQQQQQKRVGAEKEAAKKLKKSSSASRNFYAGVGKNAPPHNLDVINSKKRTNGYCECCKQRYDNLKQHLTSLQHENFGNNPLNFKEIDQYVEGILNFRQFLLKQGLISQEEEEKERKQCDAEMEEAKEPMTKNDRSTSLAELKEFAIVFGKKRQSLGLSQNQIAEKLNDPLFTETTIERFERLDITPRSGSRIKPVLERLINSKELKFDDDGQSDRLVTPTNNKEQEHHYLDSEMGKKRKRVLTLSSQKIQVLNDAFSRDPNPNDTRLRELSNQVSLDSEVVRVWFNDKRESSATQASQAQSLIKKFKPTGGYLSKNVMLNLIENQQLNSSILEDSDPAMNTSGILASPQHQSHQKQAANTTTTTRQDNHANVERKSLTNKQSIPSLVTPAKAFTISDSRLQITITGTPSPIALSSPSAAVLFNLNSNNNSYSMPSTHDNQPSFNHPHHPLHPSYHQQHQQNSSGKRRQSTSRVSNTSLNKRRSSTSSRLRASRIDFSSSEVNNSPRSSAAVNTNNTTGTELSGIDDVVAAAFMSDFSYEIVQK